jgi:sugar lactone lactonase YvrE
MGARHSARRSRSWGAGRVLSITADGTPEVEAEVASFPMCIDFLPDGRLLVVSSAERQVVRREPDGSLVLHADLAPVSTKPWNDIVVDGRGNAYVNTIGFDFPGEEPAPGMVVLARPDGEVVMVADDLAFPNGMAITADGGTLIVAESYGERLTAYDVANDGKLSGRRVWAATPGGHPDGICLDVTGAVWYADVGNRHCVRLNEGGQVVETVDTDRGAFACALSRGDDRSCSWWVSTGPVPMPSGVRPVRYWPSPRPRPRPATATLRPLARPPAW